MTAQDTIAIKAAREKYRKSGSIEDARALLILLDVYTPPAPQDALSDSVFEAIKRRVFVERKHGVLGGIDAQQLYCDAAILCNELDRLTKKAPLPVTDAAWTKEEREQVEACHKYLGRLLRGEHLTPDFLKHAVNDKPNAPLPAGRLPPGPFSYWTTSPTENHGEGHVYIVDANERKVAALWGQPSEKMAMAALIIEAAQSKQPTQDDVFNIIRQYGVCDRAASRIMALFGRTGK